MPCFLFYPCSIRVHPWLIQMFLKFRPGSRIRNILRLQSTTARLLYSMAHYIHAVSIVRIGADDDRYAMALGGRAVDVVEIQPRWIGVELEQLAMSRGSDEDLLHVDFVRLATID